MAVNKQFFLSLSQNRGYTIVEIIVVITLIGIILPAVFTILYSILQQQAKISEITEVRRQGDYIVQYMKDKIAREAQEIHRNLPLGSSYYYQICHQAQSQYVSDAESGSDMVFNLSNSPFRFNQAGNHIVQIANSVQTSLNTDRVVIDDFTISCRKNSAFQNTLVVFTFNIKYNKPPDSPLGETSLSYQSRVRLR